MIVVDVVQSPGRQALTRAFFALCTPRVWRKLRDQWVEGPEVEQRTFKQVQEVDVFAVGELNLVDRSECGSWLASYETSW